MTWRDRLKKGSFREIEFYTEQAGGQAGRRVAIHEYPKREQYYTEDLGKKAETETLKMYVLGSDYDQQRDKLMAALNKSDSGKLIHPYLGTFQIQVTSYDWTISSRKGGYCEFSVQYVRAGKRVSPTSVPSSAKKLTTAVDNAKEKAKANFTANFSVDDTAAFVEEAVEDKLDEVIQALREINGQISGYLEPIGEVAGEIDDFADQLSALIPDPEALAEAFVGVIDTVFEQIEDMPTVMAAYDRLLETVDDVGVTVDTSIIRTTNRLQEVTNAAQMNALIIASSVLATTQVVAGQASEVAQSIFTTLSEAQDVRDSLLEQVDILIEAVVEDSYDVWADLQTALIRLISEIEPNLAKAKTTQLAESLPALVLAYKLYGDASRESELISRNSISNAVLVSAGVDLEVLS